MESSRLRQAHVQAIAEVNAQIRHWESVKNDYGHLSDRLTTLPDKTVYNVMVPFGPLAFMPGKLVHTNELMVHLGDSWFADVSCKQGLHIIDHRVKTVEKNLDDLKSVLKNIEKKSEFAEELDNTGSEPAFEIKEEVPSNYAHPSRRKRISRVKPEHANGSQSHEVSEENVQSSDVQSISDSDAMKSCFNDEELMKRLDELEKEEEEQDRLLLAGVEHVQSSQDKLSPKSNEKKVSWRKKIVEGREAESDDSDECPPVVSTIHFQHSFVQKHEHSPVKKQKEASDPSIIVSPGDIGRVRLGYSNQNKNTINEKGDGNPNPQKIPTNSGKSRHKSILKPSISHTKSDDEIKKDSAQKSQVAVADNVVERSRITRTEEKITSKKPVSKFKASRKR